MRCARLSLTRVLFALAGTMTLLAVVLAVSPWLLRASSCCAPTSVVAPPSGPGIAETSGSARASMSGAPWPAGRVVTPRPASAAIAVEVST